MITKKDEKGLNKGAGRALNWGERGREKRDKQEDKKKKQNRKYASYIRKYTHTHTRFVFDMYIYFNFRFNRREMLKKEI